MHAAEDDEFCVLLSGCDLGEFEAITCEVGEAVDIVLLVVMTEDDQT